MLSGEQRRILRFIALAFLLIIVFLLSLLWGRYPQPGLTSLNTLRVNALAQALVMKVRLPRALMAIMLGASLASAGMVLQTVLGNPLVEPGLLGVSQGAAFGAALGILLSTGSYWHISVLASFFGLMGLMLSWLLARKIRYGGSMLRLVLSGVMISALFSSGLGVLKYLADPRSQLPEITFWLMGGLSGSNWILVIRTLPPVALTLLIILLVRWRVNLFSLDDRSAFALGSSPNRERITLIVFSVISVATVTAAAGVISWGGLLIPHVARKIEGADTSRSLPLSMILGAIFVLLCDDVARYLRGGELPLGLLTAFCGALMFAILMSRRGNTYSR